MTGTLGSSRTAQQLSQKNEVLSLINLILDASDCKSRLEEIAQAHAALVAENEALDRKRQELAERESAVIDLEARERRCREREAALKEFKDELSNMEV